MATECAHTAGEYNKHTSLYLLLLEHYEILLETALILLPVFAPHLLAASMVIIAGSSIMVLLDAANYKSTLSKQRCMPCKSKIKLGVATAAAAEGMTALGDIIQNITQNLSRLCALLSWASLVLLSIMTTYHIGTFIHTLCILGYNDPAAIDALVKTGSNVLFHSFFLFSAITAFVTIPPITLAITTGCAALFSILLMTQKHLRLCKPKPTELLLFSPQLPPANETPENRRAPSPALCT